MTRHVCDTDGLSTSARRRNRPRLLRLSRRRVRGKTKPPRFTDTNLTSRPGTSAFDGLARSVVTGTRRFKEMKRPFSASRRPDDEHAAILFAAR